LLRRHANGPLVSIGRVQIHDERTDGKKTIYYCAGNSKLWSVTGSVLTCQCRGFGERLAVLSESSLKKLEESQSHIDGRLRSFMKLFPTARASMMDPRHTQLVHRIVRELENHPTNQGLCYSDLCHLLCHFRIADSLPQYAEGRANVLQFVFGQDILPPIKQPISSTCCGRE
jgi:hypothetical protein